MPLLVTAAVALAGCLEYSPHELPEDESERDLHRKAVARLSASPADGAFRFAVVGDTQRNFDAAQELVWALNRRDDLAFVVQLGDFTNLGLSFEYETMNGLFAELRVPYFVTIGNHDLLANGQAIYEHMFGPLDFSFTYGRVRFVLLNTNGREFSFSLDVPDLDWLEAQLAPDVEHDRAVVFSHAGTVDTEFHPLLRDRYRDLLRVAGAIAMHGHGHKHDVREEAGVVMYRADSAEHWSYLLVTAGPDGFAVEQVFF